MNEKELFNSIFECFKEKYPAQELEMKDPYVYRKGICIFNSEGWALLYNLQRLCDAIKEELL